MSPRGGPDTLRAVEYLEVLAVAVAAAALLMSGTWLLSLRMRDVSIIDPVWGLAFAVVAVAAALVADGDAGRRALLVTLTAVWGLRLFAHLAWRRRGHGEDPRYAAMRARNPETFARRSLVTVFGLQAALVVVVSLPVQMGQVPGSPGLGVLAAAGAAVWLVGLVFETVGDLQLARFRARPDSRGRVLDTGLWRYTRHPNYFGDFLVWWGLFLVAAESGVWWTVAGPVVMSVLLMRVSGVTLLERDIAARRPGYAAYARRTSAFFPRPPRREAV